MAVIEGHGPDHCFRGALGGGHIWWVAPSYPIAAEIWRSLKTSLRGAWKNKHEVEKTIELWTGGIITVKSADKPESLVGVGLDGLVVDEAGTVKEEAWKESLRPALADKQGWAIFIGTPKGHNWFEELYVRGQEADGRWESWQLPSSQNPLMTVEELADIRRDSGPHKYAQEIEAQFTNVEGAEFPEEWFTDILVADIPETFELVALAVDPSKGKDTGDYSGVIVLGLKDNILWVDAIVEKLPIPQLTRRTISQACKYRPHTFVVEGNAWQDAALLLPFSMEIERQGQSITPPEPRVNKAKKEGRIQQLAPYLERSRIKIKDNPGGRLLVTQLREFPVGSNDDGPDALQMAIMAAMDFQRGLFGEEPERVVA